ncbi:MAG: N-methyl-L-tryptophan oxidase [Chloroflexi bacterium]|nr:N-methyl-L-tryptophan oxidase [Chloroflexota bacterium]MDA1297273.1 N-methyl-L-tryptophan oxidase [Chloroflexota bacterium]
MATSYDVIVAGVGGMGSATVYELAKRGRRVLGLEKFDIPNDQGSSHGVNRIIRLAYYEHPSYVPLLRRSYELWREIEERVQEKLLFTTGSVDTDTESGEVFRGSLNSCQLHDIPHEVLTAAETNQRFPGYRLPGGHYSLLQPDGGFLLSERCIVAYANAAMGLGAEVHAREAVLGWDATGSGTVRVTTDRGDYEAGSLVITAGAWSEKLIPQLAGRAVPERQVLAWLQPEDPHLFSPDRFPVFNAMFEEGRYYGFPVFGIPGFKIGRYHHLDEQVDADNVQREVTREDEAVLRSAVARYFPAANGNVMSMKTCMFTNSPDEHFIIGALPELPQVSFAAGFSGHGFKFCSVVGEIMADLATRRQTVHDIAMFRPGRF